MTSHLARAIDDGGPFVIIILIFAAAGLPAVLAALAISIRRHLKERAAFFDVMHTAHDDPEALLEAPARGQDVRPPFRDLARAILEARGARVGADLLSSRLGALVHAEAAPSPAAVTLAAAAVALFVVGPVAFGCLGRVYGVTTIFAALCVGTTGSLGVLVDRAVGDTDWPVLAGLGAGALLAVPTVTLLIMELAVRSGPGRRARAVALAHALGAGADLGRRRAPSRVWHASWLATSILALLVGGLSLAVWPGLRQRDILGAARSAPPQPAEAVAGLTLPVTASPLPLEEARASLIVAVDSGAPAPVLARILDAAHATGHGRFAIAARAKSGALRALPVRFPSPVPSAPWEGQESTVVTARERGAVWVNSRPVHDLARLSDRLGLAVERRLTRGGRSTRQRDEELHTRSVEEVSQEALEGILSALAEPDLGLVVHLSASGLAVAGVDLGSPAPEALAGALTDEADLGNVTVELAPDVDVARLVSILDALAAARPEGSPPVGVQTTDMPPPGR